MFWTVAAAATLYLTGVGAGRVPPLGPFLDPASGIWAVAMAAERPERSAVELPGLGAKVRVAFDDRGVPHIFARSAEDAARALGYVVARDRLFELEMRWRTAAGRLSEILGPGALEFDRRMRRLGLAWSAERGGDHIDAADPAVREVRAYAEGVNAFIESMGRRGIPIEYRLLGVRPARWEPAYSWYFLQLMGWNLAYDPSPDRVRRRAAAVVGPEAAAALFPVRSPIQEPIQPNGRDRPRYDFEPIPAPRRPVEIGTMRASAREPERPPIGSNNWAVAPRRTAAGHALLAGDPHLELTLPSIWYEAHLIVPGELDVYGVTMPSIPHIVIGFNRDVAWTFTNTGADVIDYYREELDDPERPARYRVDGEWRPLERRVERYLGRDGSALAVDTLYATHRGPLMHVDGAWMSMRWTVLESTMEEATALRSGMRAGTVREWLDAMAAFGAPAQNGVAADRAGAITIRSTGRFPLHPDGSGLEIRDGSRSASDWVGYWPVDRFPAAIDPEQGYLASANQQPIDPLDDDTYLGAAWPAPWRAMRINALLRADSQVTPDDMRRFQTDPENERTRYFLPFFLRAAESASARSGARRAADLLHAWDGRYTRENERAVLFEYAMEELRLRIWDVPGLPAPGSTVLASLMEQPESPWWDDRRTVNTVERRDDILRYSLAAALDTARSRHGDPADGGWRWDRIRHARIDHLLGIPSMSARNVPLQGGRGNLNPSMGQGRHGASWRMVVELGPDVRAWTIYPGGQSGNPASRWYDDRIDAWSRGELEEALFPRSPDDLAADRTAELLELVPPGSPEAR